jgi:hypothetical protein
MYRGSRKTRKEGTVMTNHEIIKRLGCLDIRDAEPEDYEALVLAIEILKEKNNEQFTHKNAQYV